ncbi:hypothetical protein EJ03DRAFT_329577 [Teratosphaeria nubilosa]|uniref:Uncharacterized protein n=1 Tax=Teratosphaeria nubilosa TaxID=161662 RepID=A0A6G1L2H6_9PEZI|nr:hypothetical protein EJ03DRAFT_329577 [Teratosphaeria nubilosa]
MSHDAAARSKWVKIGIKRRKENSPPPDADRLSDRDMAILMDMGNRIKELADWHRDENERLSAFVTMCYSGKAGSSVTQDEIWQDYTFFHPPSARFQAEVDAGAMRSSVVPTSHRCAHPRGAIELMAHRSGSLMA